MAMERNRRPQNRKSGPEDETEKDGNVASAEAAEAEPSTPSEKVDFSDIEKHNIVSVGGKRKKILKYMGQRENSWLVFRN